MVCSVVAVLLVTTGGFAAEEKSYSDDEIVKLEVSLLFEHLETPQTGYSVYAAPKALGKKCILEPKLALEILNRTTQLYFGSKSDLAKRQCLLVLTDSGSFVTLPVMIHALEHGETAALRALAAYCLPFYGNGKTISVAALKTALEVETDDSVRSSVEQSLQRLK
jgi:hypothetical protein